jgi:hypothetical protein
MMIRKNSLATLAIQESRLIAQWVEIDKARNGTHYNKNKFKIETLP